MVWRSYMPSFMKIDNISGQWIGTIDLLLTTFNMAAKFGCVNENFFFKLYEEVRQYHQTLKISLQYSCEER